MDFVLKVFLSNQLFWGAHVGDRAAHTTTDEAANH